MAVECPEDSDQFSTVSLKSACSPAASQRVKRGAGESKIWLRHSCPSTETRSGGACGRGTSQTHWSRMWTYAMWWKSSLLGETEMWVYHACCPAYYLVLFPRGEWLHHSRKIPIMDSQGQGDCPAHLLQTTSTLAYKGGAQQTTKQLCKHRLVPGVVSLIRDVHWEMLW